MNPTTEKAIKKVIQACAEHKQIRITYHFKTKGNVSFRFLDGDNGDKLIAQFSLASIIKKRVAKRKTK